MRSRRDFTVPYLVPLLAGRTRTGPERGRASRDHNVLRHLPGRVGATVIELIVVIAVTAVLLGIAVASIKPRDQVQVDQFLQRVPMVVQKARYDAITRNAFSRVTVDGGALVLALDTNPFTDVQSYLAYDSLVAGGAGFEAVTLELTSAGSSIEFEPRGVPRGTAPITVRVASASNPAYAFLLSISMQGRVSWGRL